MNESNLTTEDHLKRSEEFEHAGQKREAFEYLRLAVKDTTDAVILCRIGDIAVDLGEWTEAESAYLHAIRLAPTWAALYEALGSLYMRHTDKENLELAQEYFLRSVEIEKTAHAYTYLGVVEDRLGLRMKARESYKAALRLDPKYEEAHYNLGVTYREEDPTEATALFREALELDPDYQLAHRELGWVLRWSNKYREGEYHIRRAIELDESDGWAYIYLGNLLWGKHDLGPAERAFLKATEVWPDDSVPFWCLAMFYDYTGRPSEADLFYQKALQQDPDDPQANMRFGLYLKEAGFPAKAKKHLERALALDPEDERIRCALANLDEDGTVCDDVPKLH